MAYCHAQTTLKTIFREDSSAYHTYYFDYDTGKPLYGRTKQGASDDSARSRGQAWAIYGFALSYRYTKETAFLQAAKRAANYFLIHLPKDKIPYWDLCFGDGSGEPRDGSAAAIAICGLLEINELAVDGNQDYRRAAEEMLRSLCDNYVSAEEKESLLEHGTYSLPSGFGIDEGCIWGDYYFTEALTRLIQRDHFVRFW